jgi:hypothetical protein
MILGASSPTKSLTIPLPFAEVAQDLAQEQTVVRIKKLLVYVCTQVWENDQHRLSQVGLLDLLQDLRSIAPTAEQLQSRLDIAVHSLSKAAEYTLVASVIMTRVGRLYPDMGARRGAADGEAYGAIAQILERDKSSDRIKKLLILACTNTWVTDSTQLAQVHLPNLVQDLHGLTPSLITLHAVLESLVNTLSKRTEYTLASQAIIQAFQALYNIERSPIEVARSPQSPSTVPPNQPPPDLSDLFNLRLELMRYANPYRAKIVLFSLLYQPFTFEQESLLKGHTLDDLLRLTIQTYRLPDLQGQLLSAAEGLADAEEYVQTAHAILSAVRSFYAHPANRFMPIEEIEEDEATAFMGTQIQTHSGDARRDRYPREEGDMTIAMPN